MNLKQNVKQKVNIILFICPFIGNGFKSYHNFTFNQTKAKVRSSDDKLSISLTIKHLSKLQHPYIK